MAKFDTVFMHESPTGFIDKIDHVIQFNTLFHVLCLHFICYLINMTIKWEMCVIDFG